MSPFESDAREIEPGLYHCIRDWHYRVGKENWDWGAIHENWLGDPYRIGGRLSGKSVLDIGGNIGSFALRALNEGASHVWSFEPEPGNIEMFNLNCATEIADGQIALKELAVWNKSHETVIFSQFQGGSAIDPLGTIMVQTISLEDLLEYIGTVDFMKMDIEGGEVVAILGCPITVLGGVVKEFAMEIHGGDSPPTMEMIHYLEQAFDVEHVPEQYMIFGKNKNVA